MSGQTSFKGVGKGKAPPPPPPPPGAGFKRASATATTPTVAPRTGGGGSLEDAMQRLKKTNTKVRHVDGRVVIEGRDGTCVEELEVAEDGEVIPYETYFYGLSNSSLPSTLISEAMPPRLAAAECDFGLEADLLAKALWEEFASSHSGDVRDGERQLLEAVELVAPHLRFLQLTVISKDSLEDSHLPRLECYSPLNSAPQDNKAALVKAACSVMEASRAMGAMVGMAVGDALGGPFEFLDVVDSEDPQHMFDLKSFTAIGAYNKFVLKPGQWTDDSSMGLCLADSLLARGTYDGSDARVRFYNWWYRGYNNAFGNQGRVGSVGLGANVRKSLADMIPGKIPSPIFASNTEDSGNGSLMRLAPIPIFYSRDAQWAARASSLSSRSTHPGSIAAAACAFFGFAIAKAIVRSTMETAPQFLDRIVEEYLELDLPEARCPEVQQLLERPESVGKEQCWNWRSHQLKIKDSLAARGSQYNGHPVKADYFGSYSVDGLAVALWSFYHTNTFNDSIVRCVNFLGDADTMAAICGQLAGAFYGYEAIDQRLRDVLEIWDNGDIACRAALLYATRANRYCTTDDNDDVDRS